jgi:hypothetical protein
VHEHDRREHRDGRQRRGVIAPSDLARAAHRRRAQAVALVAAARDRLEHDDRVVDQHADAEREAAERHDVERDAPEVHRRERDDTEIGIETPMITSAGAGAGSQITERSRASPPITAELLTSSTAARMKVDWSLRTAMRASSRKRWRGSRSSRAPPSCVRLPASELRRRFCCSRRAEDALAHLVGQRDDVGARLAVDRDLDRLGAADAARHLALGEGALDRRHVAHADRRLAAAHEREVSISSRSLNSFCVRTRYSVEPSRISRPTR